MIDTEIEVFRADTAASRGITAADIAEVASFDCDANPVPFCFGHPANDEPAAGTFKAFRADGNRLFATIANVTDKALEGLKSGAWINRSMAFFDPTHEANPRPGKWSPRHVGLLGAAAPGIPGMEPLAKAFSFAADGVLVVDGPPADAVIYAGAPTPTVTIFSTKEAAAMELVKTPEMIEAERLVEADRAALAAERATFAAQVKATNERGNAALVDGLVAVGKVLPAEADSLKLVFNALETNELTFAADRKGTAAVELATFLGNALPKRAPVGETRHSPDVTFDADNAGKSPADLTAKANAMIAANPALTFEAAMEKLAAA